VLCARGTDGESVATLPEHEIVADNAVSFLFGPTGPVRVKVLEFSEAAFICWLNVTVTLPLGDTPVAPARGLVVTTTNCEFVDEEPTEFPPPHPDEAIAVANSRIKP
jgi:hypothetical protein